MRMSISVVSEFVCLSFLSSSSRSFLGPPRDRKRSQDKNFLFLCLSLIVRLLFLLPRWTRWKARLFHGLLPSPECKCGTGQEVAGARWAKAARLSRTWRASVRRRKKLNIFFNGTRRSGTTDSCSSRPLSAPRSAGSTRTRVAL